MDSGTMKYTQDEIGPVQQGLPELVDIRLNGGPYYLNPLQLEGESSSSLQVNYRGGEEGLSTITWARITASGSYQ